MSVYPGDDLQTGLQLLQSGQLAAAAEYFTGVVQCEPTNGLAFGYLGIALTRLGQTEQALAALGQASQLQPQDPAAQYNVAIGLMHAGRQQDAVPFLHYTLQLDPNHAQAQAALQNIVGQQTAPPVAPDQQTATTPISGPVYPASQPAGMHFAAAPQQKTVFVRPDLGTRLGRGLGWGAAYGQYWTAWNLFWLAVWSFSSLGVSGLLFWLAIFLVVFTIGGILAGLIIALLTPSVNSGVAVGVVFGLIFFALDVFVLQQGSNSAYINVIFWIFTGRYIGANIAARVHRPVAQ